MQNNKELGVTDFTSNVLGGFLEKYNLERALRRPFYVWPAWHNHYTDITQKRYFKTRFHKWWHRFIHRKEIERLQKDYAVELKGLKDGSWYWKEYKISVGDFPTFHYFCCVPYTQEEKENNPYSAGKTIKIKRPGYEQAKKEKD